MFTADVQQGDSRAASSSGDRESAERSARHTRGLNFPSIMSDLPESMKKRVRRWRAAHPEWKTRERLRYYRQFQLNNKHKGKPWTERELDRIIAPNSPPDSKLSKQLGRSVQAIQMQRSRLKKLVV
jgi:hypothetical protein